MSAANPLESSLSAETISADTMVPDLLRAFPQARAVLDQYGLRGCGGPLGPVESLAFFARAHDVPLDRLLDELREACAKTEVEAPAPDSAEENLADTIYIPFFKAGIAIALTLGAVWGAYLLLRIAYAGSFTAIGIHEVNAHGHAQIFGWVGLFVMGFAYQAFPRFKQTYLTRPRLAIGTLWLMLAGIVSRSLAEPFLPGSNWLIAAGALGSALEVVAIGLFIFIMRETLRRSLQPVAVYEYYVACSMVWFLFQAAAEGAYFVATATATSRDHLLSLVATYQAPLRDVQIHGFILLMVLGVSQRILHFFYGFSRPGARLNLIALPLLNLALIAECSGLLLMRMQSHAWAALWYAGVLILGGTVGALVVSWGVFGPSAESDRSLKFIRTAYAWLLLSLAMLVLLPVYQFVLLPAFAPSSNAAAAGFSHAYYGATRHAITVGFISMMIVGVAAKVVPTLKGLDVRALGGLWVPFALLNLGCAMRVFFQTLTDFTSFAFPFAGVSGMLEVTALALWGAHLWRIMNGYAPVPRAAAPVYRAGDVVRPDHVVGHVIRQDPRALDILIDLGFTPLANPLLRKTVANAVTFEQAARKIGIDVNAVLETLNNRPHRARPAGG
jgi:hypothetical protein